jgi:AP2-associated kinase
MLRENPQQRPNIYHTVKEVCSIRNTDCPIQDIYANRSQSETRKYEQLPSRDIDVASPPIVGISKVKSVDLPSQSSLPDITPMRRGRPTNAPQNLSVSARVTPAGSRGTSSDPFAALDSKDVQVRVQAVDELAAKFPSLDEFSLLHDRGAKFEFSPEAAALPKDESINKKVTAALADEAFGQPSGPSKLRPTESTPASNTSSSTDLRRAGSQRKTKPEISQLPVDIRSQPHPIHEPIPIPKRSTMVSTGVQTSDPPSPSPPKRFEVSSKPVWRVPQTVSDNKRATSQPSSWQPVSTFDTELPPRPEKANSRPSLLDRHRTKSQTLNIPNSPASSRPSLDGQRPVAADFGDPISRSQSANAWPRPASAFVESNLDYLKDREYSKDKVLPTVPRPEPRRSSSALVDNPSDDEGPENVDSNVNFLRDLEQDKKHSRRRSSGKSHRKVPSISLSGTKNIITGKFSDAFKKFEGGHHHHHHHERDESPPRDDQHLRQRALTPIAGSEATGTSRGSDDVAPLEETEDLPPEVRRELERQQLEREEQRVAAAAAEYKNNMAHPAANRLVAQQKGSAIQNRVKELLDSTKEVQYSKTAEGYGKFTDGGSLQRSTTADRPPVGRKPVGMSRPAAVANATGPRPNVAPKPKTLRTGGGPSSPALPPAQTDEDWEANFQKKYPSLAGLEMVETDIRPTTRVKDV